MPIAGVPLHPDAIGLRLIRFTSRKTYFCETVLFENDHAAVDTVLRRAAIAGRVEVEGEVKDHQADVIIDQDGTWDQVIALDAKSYQSLKNRWMRCKIESIERN